jgi:hypothetical protein
MTDPTPEFVIGAYHQLWQIVKSFRMSKYDLRARPICHHKRESIEAHMTIVFAALAVTRLIENRTGWSIKKFVRTARATEPSRPRRRARHHRSRPTPHRPTRRTRPDHLTSCTNLAESGQRILAAAGADHQGLHGGRS